MASTRAPVPQGFDHIHRILGSAMRAAPKQAWPTKPHLGGPMPVLSTARQVDVGVLVARRAQAHAPDDAGRDFLDSMATVTAGLRDGRLRRDKPALDKASKSDKKDDLAHRIGRLVLRSIYNHRHAASSALNSIGQSVERAAEATVLMIGTDSVAVRAFLEELDGALLRHDLEEMLADKGLTPSSRVERVLSRPPATKGKTVGLVFAALEGGNYGLFVKLKQRWSWHEGDRETMFATVPDEYMEYVIEDLDKKRTLRRSRAK